MNLDTDFGSRENALKPEIFSLLVLVAEWSNLGQGAFMHTDLLLLLVQAVQAAISRVGHVSNFCSPQLCAL